MFKVRIQFANAYRERYFEDKASANRYGNDCLDIFEGEEKWFDKGTNTYMVTVPNTEIN